MGCGSSSPAAAGAAAPAAPPARSPRRTPTPSPRGSVTNLEEAKAALEAASLEQHQGPKAMAVGSLKPLSPAIFLAAMFNDVAFFKALPSVQLMLEMAQLSEWRKCNRGKESGSFRCASSVGTLGGGASGGGGSASSSASSSAGSGGGTPAPAAGGAAATAPAALAAGPSIKALLAAVDPHGETLMQVAAYSGSADVLELFLDIEPGEVRRKHAQDSSCLLHYAVRGFSAHATEVVKTVRSYLLHHPELQLHAEGEEGGGEGGALGSGSAALSHASLAGAALEAHGSHPSLVPGYTTYSSEPPAPLASLAFSGSLPASACSSSRNLLVGGGRGEAAAAAAAAAAKLVAAAALEAQAGIALGGASSASLAAAARLAADGGPAPAHPPLLPAAAKGAALPSSASSASLSGAEYKEEVQDVLHIRGLEYLRGLLQYSRRYERNAYSEQVTIETDATTKALLVKSQSTLDQLVGSAGVGATIGGAFSETPRPGAAEGGFAPAGVMRLPLQQQQQQQPGAAAAAAPAAPAPAAATSSSAAAAAAAAPEPPAPLRISAAADSAPGAFPAAAAAATPEALTPLPTFTPLILSLPAFSRSKVLLQSALTDPLVGHEEFGHGEAGVLPYLNTRFNCTRAGLNMDINRFEPTQRFPQRSSERTVRVLLHHRATTLAKNRYGKRPLAVARAHLAVQREEAAAGGAAELYSTLPSAGGAHVLLDPPWHYPAASKHREQGLLEHVSIEWDKVVALLEAAQGKEEEEAGGAGGGGATPRPGAQAGEVPGSSPLRGTAATAAAAAASSSSSSSVGAGGGSAPSSASTTPVKV